jgi:hypothetical protein
VTGEQREIGAYRTEQSTQESERTGDGGRELAAGCDAQADSHLCVTPAATNLLRASWRRMLAP